jgi:glycine cleavage system H lipoate-binding protein
VVLQVNKDPYNAWFMKVKVSNPGDLGDTMSAEEYDKFIEDN